MDHTMKPAGQSGNPPLVTRIDDDPAVVADAAVDDYALHIVPPNWRLGRIRQAVSWSATAAALFWVVVPALAASVVGTQQALIGLVVAFVFYTVVCYPIQKAATESGATLATFSRSVMGSIGVPIASLIFVASALTLAVFEGAVLAVAFEVYFGGSIYIWYGAVALFCTLITLGGVRVWLEKLNAWLLPVFLVGLFGALIWAIVQYGYQPEWFSAESPNPSAFFGPGWLHAFGLYLTGIVNVLYVFDFARMGKEQDGRFNGHVTYGSVYWILVLLVIGCIGIYLSQAIPVDGVNETQVVRGIVLMMGIWGLIYIFATQTKIQSANVYLSSLNLQILASRSVKLTLPRTVWTFVVGVLLFVIMSANIFDFLSELLSFQGVLAIAWVAVALVHIFINDARTRKGRFEVRPGRIPRVNPGGLAGWLSGSVAGLSLLAFGSAFSLTFALIITWAVSTVVYCVCLFFVKTVWFRLRRPFDPVDEIGTDPLSIHVRCHSCRKYYVAVEMDRDPSHDHDAICVSCAGGRDFQSAARLESLEYDR